MDASDFSKTLGLLLDNPDAEIKRVALKLAKRQRDWLRENGKLTDDLETQYHLAVGTKEKRL